METSSPRSARTVVVGGGTMGADVAVVLARGGAHVTVVDPHTDRRNRLLPHIAQELAAENDLNTARLALDQIVVHRRSWFAVLAALLAEHAPQLLL